MAPSSAAPFAPLVVKIAAAGILVLAALAAYVYGRGLWMLITSGESTSLLVPMVVVFVVGVGVFPVALALIWRGSVITPFYVTVLGLWGAGRFLLGIEGTLIALVSVTVVVLVWLPQSRQFGKAAREHWRRDADRGSGLSTKKF